MTNVQAAEVGGGWRPCEFVWLRGACQDYVCSQLKSQRRKERGGIFVAITVVTDNLKTSITLPTTLSIYLMPHGIHALSSCPRVEVM